MPIVASGSSNSDWQQLKRFACSGDMLTTRGIRGGSACACCIGPWVLMLRRRLWAGWLPVCLPAVAAERHALGAVVADHVDGRWVLVVGLAGDGDEHVAPRPVHVQAEGLDRQAEGDRRHHLPGL